MSGFLLFVVGLFIGFVVNDYIGANSVLRTGVRKIRDLLSAAIQNLRDRMGG